MKNSLWGEQYQLEISKKDKEKNDPHKLAERSFVITYLIGKNPFKYGHLFDELYSMWNILINKFPEKNFLWFHDLSQSAYRTGNLDLPIILYLAEKSLYYIIEIYKNTKKFYNELYMNLIELMIAIYDNPSFNFPEKENKIQKIALLNIKFAKLVKLPSILEIRYRGGNLYHHIIIPSKYYEVI